MSRHRGEIVVDIRAFDAALRRAMVFSIVDTMLEIGSKDQIVLICDHEPAGLGYQIDLRRESRGHFELSYARRSDGAWVAFVRPKGSKPSDYARDKSAEIRE